MGQIIEIGVVIDSGISIESHGLERITLRRWFCAALDVSGEIGAEISIIDKVSGVACYVA